VFVASAFDFSDHKAAAYAPQMTLDMYLAFPEDASKLIEVVDGWIVRCESAEPSHQAIQLHLLIAIREAAGLRDRANQSCHRVLGDMDVLIADSPKLHFRRPDVVVYRCIDDDRGRWGRKPIGKGSRSVAVTSTPSTPSAHSRSNSPGKRWTKACKPGSKHHRPF
jgi:putative restriction endonuclease